MLLIIDTVTDASARSTTTLTVANEESGVSVHQNEPLHPKSTFQPVTATRSSPRRKANQSGQSLREPLRHKTCLPLPNPTTNSHSSDESSSLTQAEAQIRFHARLFLSRNEEEAAKSRRQALREKQAAQSSSLTEHEPNLNGSEVRHFEVNGQGSLTFILFDTYEAWVLEEIEEHKYNGTLQMIAGRGYRVLKI